MGLNTESTYKISELLYARVRGSSWQDFCSIPAPCSPIRVGVDITTNYWIEKLFLKS
jgi:hypothetical protein